MKHGLSILAAAVLFCCMPAVAQEDEAFWSMFEERLRSREVATLVSLLDGEVSTRKAPLPRTANQHLMTGMCLHLYYSPKAMERLNQGEVLDEEVSLALRRAKASLSEAIKLDGLSKNNRGQAGAVAKFLDALLDESAHMLAKDTLVPDTIKKKVKGVLEQSISEGGSIHKAILKDAAAAADAFNEQKKAIEKANDRIARAFVRVEALERNIATMLKILGELDDTSASKEMEIFQNRLNNAKVALEHAGISKFVAKKTPTSLPSQDAIPYPLHLTLDYLEKSAPEKLETMKKKVVAKLNATAHAGDLSQEFLEWLYRTDTAMALEFERLLEEGRKKEAGR